jgi:hypothetical protein
MWDMGNYAKYETTTMKITTLHITFDIPLQPKEITQFRGAIAEHAGWADDAFHNHAAKGDTVLYRYPIIQYRSVEGRATIFSINAGVDTVLDMLSRTNPIMDIGRTTVELAVCDSVKRVRNLEVSDTPKQYYLKNWLALNADNYKKWQTLPSLGERVAMLEQILSSNIVSFAKGVAWQLPVRVEAKLVQLQHTHKIISHRTELIAFDVVFAANIDLPEGLGLGKSCSLGFGVVSVNHKSL